MKTHTTNPTHPHLSMHIKQCRRGEKNQTSESLKTNWDTRCHILRGRERDALLLLKDRWIHQSVVCQCAKGQLVTKHPAPESRDLSGSLWRPNQLSDWEVNCVGQTQMLPCNYYQSYWATSSGLTEELHVDKTAECSTALKTG